MQKISVLVTGIGGGGHGEQILKSLKLIKDIPLEIIGTDITEYTTGRKLVDLFYVVPGVSDSLYEKKLFEIIEKHDVKFVFHGSEPELKFLSQHRAKLEKLGIGHPLNSSEIIALCMDKYKTYLRLSALGIKIPKYAKVNAIDDLQKIDFFPVILKPSTGSGGSSGVFLIFDREELDLIGQYMLKLGMDVIAQEYIGDKENEYTIGVSSDKNGVVIGSVIVKRLMTNALTTFKKFTRLGKEHTISSGISQGFICHNESLAAQAESIARQLESVGPLNIQCRLVDRELMLFEINPRLSGTTSLRSMAGYNEPEMMLKKHLNLPVTNLLKYSDKLILRTIQEVSLS